MSPPLPSLLLRGSVRREAGREIEKERYRERERKRVTEEEREREGEGGGRERDRERVGISSAATYPLDLLSRLPSVFLSSRLLPLSRCTKAKREQKKTRSSVQLTRANMHRGRNYTTSTLRARRGSTGKGVLALVMMVVVVSTLWTSSSTSPRDDEEKFDPRVHTSFLLFRRMSVARSSVLFGPSIQGCRERNCHRFLRRLIAVIKYSPTLAFARVASCKRCFSLQYDTDKDPRLAQANSVRSKNGPSSPKGRPAASLLF